MSKNIVVYSDGTGQDGGARPEQRISNIYKMYRISRDHADTAIDPSQQVVFYDAGLGTDVGTTALTAPVRFVQKLLGSVTGAGIKRNIADCSSSSSTTTRLTTGYFCSASAVAPTRSAASRTC
jgi:uncharacterized protein (DUF2235 family)